MFPKPLEWLRAESGAVTVDWTVLAAAVVGLGVATVGAVRTGAINLGNDVGTSLSSASVVSLGSLGGTGGSTWQYSPLFSGITMDWMNGPGGLIAQISAWNYTPAQLQSTYNSYASSAQAYIDAGNSHYAGLYVDHMYAVQQILTTQGVAVDAAAPTVQALHDVVSAM